MCSAFSATEPTARISCTGRCGWLPTPAGRGVVVLIREPSPTSLSDRVRAKLADAPPQPIKLREIGVGAQILRDLGVHDMILLSNAQRPAVALNGFRP